MYGYGFVFYFAIWPITNFLLKKVLPRNKRETEESQKQK